MKILVIGGTKFVGRALVEAALANGHEVTLFNRGQTNPDLFSNVEKLRGDRHTADGLDQLADRTWDAALDVSAYVPQAVTGLAEHITDAVAHYTFISTISVYASSLQPGDGEDAALEPLPAGADANGDTPATYGARKALCEQAAEAAFPGRTLIVRPGLVAGPHDHTDRFTYWPVRVAKGGHVLAPAGPETPTQFIDVRDLAAFTVKMLEEKMTGAFNATGLAEPYRIGNVLDACKAVTDSDATFVWASEDFLLENNVGPWREMPLWLSKASRNLMQVSVDKAIAAGLTFRPLEDTIRDTLDWHNSRLADGDATGLSGPLTAEREHELLALWEQAR